ncbi:MAG: hypothetical protein ACLQJR_17030 [Stellaceae bacterium]
MYVRNTEPSVEELLGDEITRLVMARDGLSDQIVRALVRDVQRRLQARRQAMEIARSGRAA